MLQPSNMLSIYVPFSFSSSLFGANEWNGMAWIQLQRKRIFNCAQQSYELNVSLFSFTLSKSNTHNPIRLFANDNNVLCSHFQTFRQDLTRGWFSHGIIRQRISMGFGFEFGFEVWFVQKRFPMCMNFGSVLWHFVNTSWWFLSPSLIFQTIFYRFFSSDVWRHWGHFLLIFAKVRRQSQHLSDFDHFSSHNIFLQHRLIAWLHGMSMSSLQCSSFQ